MTALFPTPQALRGRFHGSPTTVLEGEAARGGLLRAWKTTTVRGVHGPARLRRRLDCKGESDAALHTCIVCAVTVLGARDGQRFCLHPRARGRGRKRIVLRAYDAHPANVLQKLDEQQERVVKLVQEGKNVVLTGGAGVGKTFTSREICAYFKNKYGDAFRQKVAVTASTGMAAALLGGSTLHSVTRIGVPQLVSHFRRTCRQNIWGEIEALIIDEASMISGEFFDRLNQAICSSRKTAIPFAGIQVVLIGDFLQLPPIEEAMPPKGKLLDNGVAVLPGCKNPEDPRYQLFLNRGYVYQSKCFREMDFVVVELKTPHRQGNRREFVDFLNHVREGTCPSQTLKEYNQRLQNKLPKKTRCTTLVPYKAMANQTNIDGLARLNSETRTFESSDDVDVLFSRALEEKTERRQRLHASFQTHCRAESTMSLKINAQVMLLVNLLPEEGLVNGSIGVVKAWSTVKKDMALKFVPRSWHARALQWLTRTCCSNKQDPVEDRRYRIPRVKFQGAERARAIGPWVFSWDIAGVGSCSRLQFPLALGWAITHHKAQGITIHAGRGEGLLVDPRGFAKGQVYVALSRVTDERGLQLLSSIKPTDIMASRNALQFYEAVRKYNEISSTLPMFRDMGPRAALAAARKAGDPSADRLEECVAAFDLLGTWEQIRP